MNSAYTHALNWNIYKYYAHKVLSKRAFLPLIAIYAVNVAGVSLFELGIVAAITALVQLILEVPSGYIADKVGHRRTLILGSIITAASPFTYILWPNLIGVTLGSAVFFAGVALHSGTIEAFVHETLLELKREKETARIMGLAQAIGLAGNVIVISLVPLSYVIDVRLPFIIGAIFLVAELIVMLTLTTPRRTHKDVRELEHVSFSRLVRAMHHSNHHLLFLLLGVSTAVAHKLPVFREILFQDLGVPVVLLGFILAASSILGAIFNYYIHKINDLMPAQKFYFIDLLIMSLLTIAIGFAVNPVLAVALFTLFVAYSRSRIVPIHAYILADSPTRQLKATYMSLLAFSSSLNSIWAPLLLGYVVAELGINQGYSAFGAITLVLSLILFALYSKFHRQIK